MHFEKNVFDNLFNTVMNVTGKTKDNDKARLDMKDICKRPTLEIYESSNGKTVKPQANYTLSKKQVEEVCTWIRSLKLPYEYASNIARCVSDKKPQEKLKGMKSHDVRSKYRRRGVEYDISNLFVFVLADYKFKFSKTKLQRFGEISCI